MKKNLRDTLRKIRKFQQGGILLQNPLQSDFSGFNSLGQTQDSSRRNTFNPTRSNVSILSAVQGDQAVRNFGLATRRQILAENQYRQNQFEFGEQQKQQRFNNAITTNKLLTDFIGESAANDYGINTRQEGGMQMVQELDAARQAVVDASLQGIFNPNIDNGQDVALAYSKFQEKFNSTPVRKQRMANTIISQSRAITDKVIKDGDGINSVELNRINELIGDYEATGNFDETKFTEALGRIRVDTDKAKTETNAAFELFENNNMMTKFFKDTTKGIQGLRTEALKGDRQAQATLFADELLRDKNRAAHYYNNAQGFVELDDKGNYVATDKMVAWVKGEIDLRLGDAGEITKVSQSPGFTNVQNADGTVSTVPTNSPQALEAKKKIAEASGTGDDELSVTERKALTQKGLIEDAAKAAGYEISPLELDRLSRGNGTIKLPVLNDDNTQKTGLTDGKPLYEDYSLDRIMSNPKLAELAGFKPISEEVKPTPPKESDINTVNVKLEVKPGVNKVEIGKGNAGKYTNNPLNVKAVPDKDGNFSVAVTDQIDKEDDSLRHRVFATQQEGMDAGVEQVQRYLTGENKTFVSNLEKDGKTIETATFKDLYKTWATGASEANTKAIADKLGVASDATLKEIQDQGITADDIALAMVSVENPEIYEQMTGKGVAPNLLQELQRQGATGFSIEDNEGTDFLVYRQDNELKRLAIGSDDFKEYEESIDKLNSKEKEGGGAPPFLSKK